MHRITMDISYLKKQNRAVAVGPPAARKLGSARGRVDRGDGQQPPGWTAWTDSGFSISTVNKRSDDDGKGKIMPSADAHPARCVALHRPAKGPWS